MLCLHVLILLMIGKEKFDRLLIIFHGFDAVTTAENGLRALEYLGLSDDQQTSHKPTVCNFLFSHFPISDKRFMFRFSIKKKKTPKKKFLWVVCSNP